MLDAQVIKETAAKKKSIKSFTVMGMSLPVYTLISFLILFAAKLEILPKNMVGALAVMMVLGSLFNLLGSRIPLVRSYLGGGAVFCIFASSALATFGLLPVSVTENCESFMNEVGFLDFYIAALITGSILGMNRELLKKAAIRFLPVSFLSMACAILMAGVMGMITGYGFGETILYIAMPMMSGGMGAGVIPLSGIYANATGLDSAQVISRMIPASAIGNVLAIICAALISKLGTAVPAINGNGKLMDIDKDKKGDEQKAVFDVEAMGTGLIFAMAFFTMGVLINQVFPNIHAYAFMIILVVICKISGMVPKKYENAAVQWSQFVMKNLTNALLSGIGIALLDLKVLAAALTPVYLLICVVIILTVAICSGLLGKLVGFYPVEASITAGLCTNSMGGTGNIAVLSAAGRMGLIPFAQMATRLGGAVILITASFLIRILS
ncbi:2-hydroxycarboxylate transporter family protein [Clostridium sp. Marseille-P2415]|uniref:2-hydroxycarboxylate transporter family protein n=1 Tax=Clostridium sp. Marseille-P2415 TaxID=1805471 RepID=UPI00111585E2|nr:2-hydroxycarboxylate transporter family protein [Clostridium sp. Marseille-P2415]